MAKSIARFLADIASTTGVLDGTLSTAAQPNVTSVGTLSSLTVSGALNGTLSTAAQTNVTSVGTLSALTVSGDLTVDTSTLKVDSTNNRVGIGNTSPASLLDVSSTGEVISTLRSTSTSGARQATLRLNVPSTGGDDPAGRVQFTYGTGYTVAGSIEMSHTTNNMKFLTGTTERMRIDASGNVGIGTGSPLGNLTIANAAGANAPTTVTAANTYLQLGNSEYGASNNGKFMIGFGYTDATNTNSPAYIGYQEASTSGDTYGDLTFYTRSVTTDTAPTERMRIDSSGSLLVGRTSDSGLGKLQVYGGADIAGGNVYLARDTGNVGIGTSSPSEKLHVNSGTGNVPALFQSTDSLALITFKDNSTSTDVGVGAQGNDQVFYAGAERMRIDSSGNVGIGTSSPVNNSNRTTLGLQGAWGGQLDIMVGSTVHAQFGTDNFSTGQSCRIQSQDGIIFKVANSLNSMRITNAGTLLVGSTGTTLGGSTVVSAGVQSSHTTVAQTMTVYNSSASCGANGIFLVGTLRAANTAFDIFNCWTAGIGDKEFKVRGDGNVFADGTFSGGGADYAEFFEWLDGNSSAEDRRGYSVVLDSGKIRVATSEDNASMIIGVISANPAMIGDNDMERWRGKYLRDDFGAYDLDENGDKQLNPDYDEAQPYVSREDRVEWDIVGLMGKLRIRKGQPSGSNWIKIKDISAGIEEWLVR